MVIQGSFFVLEHVLEELKKALAEGKASPQKTSGILALLADNVARGARCSERIVSMLHENGPAEK